MALLLLLFIVVPIVELYVILQVGQAIGVVPTIALLIADSILGSLLMRSQGRAVWRRFADATAAGRVPAREVVDGVLVIFGGALLLTPGFTTDVVGLLFLLPPTRALLRGVLLRRLGPRMVASVTDRVAMRAGRGRGPAPGAAPPDVDGTAQEVDPTALR